MHTGPAAQGLAARAQQDEVIAGLLRRPWARAPADNHPFSSLQEMCGLWADWFELDYAADRRGLARREAWLMIDPKPFVGDPAFDPVQHMRGCDERLASGPKRLAQRMADLVDLDPERVRLWLFARCAQESLHDVTMREAARRLAP